MAAAITLLPICATEVDGVVPEGASTDLFLDAETPSQTSQSALEEVKADAPFSSPMVEELEAPPGADDGEIQMHLEAAMRRTVKRMMSEAKRAASDSALAEGKAQGLQAEQLQQRMQDAVRRAARTVHSKLTDELVEQAAKAEAVKVAKQHAKAAAAKAAARGASAAEQASTARSTASAVALSFAKMAKQTGLQIAKDEAALQAHDPALELTGTDVSEQQTPAAAPSTDNDQHIAESITAAAEEGVSNGVSDAKAVAKSQAEKAGLSAAQTKKLEDSATAAVKDAASGLQGGGAGGVAASSGNTAADTYAYANGDGGEHISLEKAQQQGVEKAKKSELAKYEKLAAEEKAKTREALEAAAKQEKNAANYVDTVATNSLARGLDKDLSTKNLKLAAAKATDASTKVEVGVKNAVNLAIKQKERLKRANEKVEKAGDDARKEAEEKNEQKRQEQYDIESSREAKEKEQRKEVAVKKEQANEAAHKAIVKVVESTGTSASRKAARDEATLIQQDFVGKACHRHVQHTLRELADAAAKKVADRGLSVDAQLDAQLNTIKSSSGKVVNDTVSNTVRRQAHLSAMNAKNQARARGLSSARQLDAARKAWKAAQPKITNLCQPSAQSAASDEEHNPGAAPEPINQHAFVVNAVQTMKTTVSKACTDATGPVVEDGAKLAAQHDADYSFQKAEGVKEAYKVCNATVELYTQNAEKMSKEMVTRSFDEDSSEKRRSTEFEQQLRETAADKVKRAQDDAERKTSEVMNKQCEKKTEEALSHAKDAAARSAVSSAADEQAHTAAQAAYDEAYKQGLDDGLSTEHAKALAQDAYDKTFSETQATAQTATEGLAPPPPATPEDLEQLQLEWHTYQQRAHKRRTQEAQVKAAVARNKAAHTHEELQHAERAASAAEEDASKVGQELEQLQAMQAAQEISVPAELLLMGGEATLSMPDKAQRQKSLVHAIAHAVKALHHLGGHLPSELELTKLKAELHDAKARIAELESR
jgi:hypothetical protein